MSVSAVITVTSALLGTISGTLTGLANQPVDTKIYAHGGTLLSDLGNQNTPASGTVTGTFLGIAGNSYDMVSTYPGGTLQTGVIVPPAIGSLIGFTATATLQAFITMSAKSQ